MLMRGPFLFCCVNYGFAFLAWAHLCLFPIYEEYLYRGLGLSGYAAAVPGAYDLLIYAAMIALPLGSVILAYRLFRRAKGWIARFAAIYAAWLVFLVVLSVALSSLGARFSVALTAGAVHLRDIESIRLADAAETFIFCHFYVLPWIAICLLLTPLYTPRPAAAGRRRSRAL